MGFSVDEFYKMSIREVLIRIHGKKLSRIKEWEHTRFIAAFVENAGKVARGGAITSPSQLTRPIDVMRLPTDPPIIGETYEEATDIWEAAEKAGVASSKRAKTLQEIFKMEEPQ